jgi:hypothetical protein
MTTVTLIGSGTVFNPATDDGNSYIFTDGSELSFDSPGMNFVGGLSITNTNPLNSFGIEGAINQNFDDAPPGTPPVNVEVQGRLQISGDLGNEAELDDSMQPGTTLTVDGNSTFTYGGQFDVVALDNPGTPADTTVQLNGTVTLSPLGTNTLDLSQNNVVGGTVIVSGENDRVELGGDQSGTELTPASGGFLMDSTGNTWTLTPTGVVAENGTAVPGGSGTSALAIVSNVIYGQDATSGSWYTYSTTNQSWTSSTPPILTATGAGTDAGTDFVLEGGIVSVGGLNAFHGTIGPLPPSSTYNGSAALAMGPFAEVEIQNAFQAASASFDTTTGTLSFLDASKNDIGDWHFAGDASGLTLNTFAGGTLILADQPGSHEGNIPITFHG